MSVATRERLYGAREIEADRWVHWIGVGAGATASMVLVGALALRQDPSRFYAGLVYGTGLIVMLGLSAAYNLALPSPRKDLLQRLDHAAIFIMIAGTYTPFIAVFAAGRLRLILLAGIWLAAGCGSALKLAYPRRREGFAVLAYLLVGWVPLMVLAPLYREASPTLLCLLAGGGVVYTFGIIFHLWEALPYHKAIWHGMVLAAAALHYGAVVLGVVI